MNKTDDELSIMENVSAMTTDSWVPLSRLWKIPRSPENAVEMLDVDERFEEKENKEEDDEEEEDEEEDGGQNVGAKDSKASGNSTW